MSILNRREAAEPAMKDEICVACKDFGGAMRQIRIGEFGPQWLCVDPVACRQRAQLRGIWKNPAAVLEQGVQP